MANASRTSIGVLLLRKLKSLHKNYLVLLLTKHPSHKGLSKTKRFNVDFHS